MDKIIEQSWLAKKKNWIIAITIFLIAFLIVFLVASQDHIPEIDPITIRTGTIEHGDFQEIVIANGSVEPKVTVLIDAQEGGTVDNILVEEGELVKAGQVLILLSNENLVLEYMQRETQIVEQINNLQNTRINLHQNLYSTEDQLVDYSKQLAIAKKQYYIDSTLAKSNGISRKVLEESRINYDFLKTKVNTLTNRRNDHSKNHGKQIEGIDNSITLMERNLELIREKLNEISIKAPISGQLNSFNIEQGQVLQQNQAIGRVDVPNKYWIRALVDQHYLNRLNEGQSATISYDGETYNLFLSKVLSTVENGQIEVFLEFENDYPKDLRRGQNFQVHVEVSAKEKTLKLAKGAFFQSSGGQFVYVISEDGKSAYKQEVELGRQNPKYYEVKAGLSEGQKVITSSYESYKEYKEIRLKKNN